MISCAHNGSKSHSFHKQQKGMSLVLQSYSFMMAMAHTLLMRCAGWQQKITLSFSACHHIQHIVLNPLMLGFLGPFSGNGKNSAMRFLKLLIRRSERLTLSKNTWLLGRRHSYQKPFWKLGKRAGSTPSIQISSLMPTSLPALWLHGMHMFQGANPQVTIVSTPISNQALMKRARHRTRVMVQPVTLRMMMRVEVVLTRLEICMIMICMITQHQILKTCLVGNWTIIHHQSTQQNTSTTYLKQLLHPVHCVRSIHTNALGLTPLWAPSPRIALIKELHLKFHSQGMSHYIKREV
jgi:hypothetical protein